MTTFTQLAQARFSVRKYTDRPVEKEKLEQVLEAARLAPTAKNQQPQRIYVLQSPEALDKLATLTHCAYGARTVLLFAYDENAEWKNPLQAGIHSGVEDVSIAATYVMLRATELGLSTTWCNYFPNSALEAAFGLPPSERAVLVMPIGYKAEDAVPAAAHTLSKPLGEMVAFL